ncbi:MAG: DNA polymerase III subunit gamma/tau [Leptolyngbyaceae cyanobacterium T60_A2020_046]|nr:DNA polymerase III subunit gamma/tau [Leptolyngbyaceae cyanobacterium T60_A2020_046]
MGYEPLHHKYRPQTFAQLVGQDAIATTLKHALEQQRIAPAYLFCGPRGTGKTSSARILAKSLNCLSSAVPTATPCGTCEVCRGITVGSILDIVEIDAASNTGVDNIRELIERAQFAPVQCRYKVYVIDECHMLSTAAFNALLKTLEEPPEHVIFVLATTDPQRVLPTIISRCQRFDFRRIPLEAMVNHLSAIAQQESITITKDAVRLVAQIAQGGLRDAESLLDQLSLLEPPVTAEKVWDLVGAVPERDLVELVRAIAQDDGAIVLETARRLMDRGREPIIVLQSLAGFYRDLLIAKTAAQRNDLVAVTPPTWEAMQQLSAEVALPVLLAGQQTLRAAETQLKNTTQPRLWLEVTLMGLLPAAIAPAPVATVAAPGGNRAIAPAPPHPTPTTPAPRPAAPATSAPATATTPAPASSPAPAPAPRPTEAAPPAALPSPAPLPQTDLTQVWEHMTAVLHPFGTRALLKQQGILLGFDGNTAQIGIKSRQLLKMAQGRVSNIEEAFAQVFQRPVKVTLEVAEEASAAAPPPAPAPSPNQPAPIAYPSAPAVSNPPPPADQSAAPPIAPPPPILGEAGAPLAWSPQSDFDRAVKSFSDFFNGQIVSVDDEDDAAPPKDDRGNNGNGNPDRDRDVPF